MKRIVAILVLSLLTVQSVLAENFDHGVWDQLLKQHVITINDGHATAVDYQGMATDRAQLKAYLALLEGVREAELDQWAEQQQLAFLINAYNAWTVELILTAWPDIESIKELGGFLSSPWSKKFIPLLGATWSLDNIEHDLIRGSGRYDDPRIHFAVNCASIGCPALRAEAYVGDKLDQQLDEQTKLFLGDRSRNTLQGNKLKVSAIFKWYREDFEKGWLGYNSLSEFLLHYADALNLPSTQIERLRSNDLDIDYLDYDWRLNEKS